MTMTTIVLDGAMGKKFGKRWTLDVSSPAEALRMIDANKPGFITWIRDNLNRYENYKVTTKRNGVELSIEEIELEMSTERDEIRFTPIVNGSGNVGKIVAGIALVAVGIFTGQGWVVSLGAGLVMGGIVGMMTSQPKVTQQDMQQRSDKTSYYFNGPVNTTAQGIPVPLIFGRCLTGSHPVSVSLTVDEEL